MTPTAIIACLAIGFVAGVGWHWLYRHDQRRIRYRVPVRERIVTVAAVRCPRPGVACENFHGLVPPGGRCRVCGERIGERSR